MKALLIEFDLQTGKRAGGISPKDPHLFCYGWQDLESEPAKEIRMVEDDRDLSIYEGVNGVTILEGKTAINDAIVANIPIRYAVKDKELLFSHMKEKNIKLDFLAHRTLNDAAKELYDLNLAGVIKREPKLIKE